MAPHPHFNPHDEGRLHQEHSNTMYPLLGPNPMALLNTLFVLLTAGQASLLFLLATLLFSKRVGKKNATMINLVLVTVLSTIPLPLLYYGQQILNPKPPFSLCFAQAVLKHGTDAMFCVAAFSLIVEILLQTGIIIWPLDDETRVRLLVALPYLVFVIFAMWAGALGSTHHSAVQHEPNDYYCSLKFTAFTRGIYVVCLVMVSLTMALEVYAIIKSRSFWRGAPQIRPVKRYSKGLYFRVLGFTVCQLFFFVLFGLGFFLQYVATNIITILYEAAMPLLTFLIFASSPDVRAAWKFWDRRIMDSSATEDFAVRPTAPEISVSAMPSQAVSPTTDEGHRPTPPALPLSAVPSVSPSTVTSVSAAVSNCRPAIPVVHLSAPPQPITDYLGVDIPDSNLGFFPYLIDDNSASEQQFPV